MDDEHPVTITLPRLKPIWAAWVAGQLLFCCGVVEAFVPESRVSAALVLAEPLPWNVMTGLALVTLGIVFGVRQAGAKKS